MRPDIQRTELYKELDKELSKDLFNYSEKKYKHNVDSLYYTVSIKDDSNDNKDILCLLNRLKDLKEKIKKDKSYPNDFEGLELKLGSYAMIYNYRLHSPDRFDIFISDYKPNKETPRIVVQIRSMALWIENFKDIVEDTFNQLKSILDGYDIEILRVMENRIDYAYHTNAIQNPYKMFNDGNLKSSLKTNLKIYSKVGEIQGQEITIDYFSLGQRKSNNVFVRFYNKTREVIEMNYKAFFIAYWYENKMISSYDKYCLEYAYKEKNYNAIDKARLLFYLEHGKDDAIKDKINKFIKDQSKSYLDMKEFADTICPKVTLILNIEYETKRKFYYYSDNVINGFDYTFDDVPSLARIFKIYENRNIFLNYLTSETASFIDKKKDDYKAFWKRLRGLKIENCNNCDMEYIRDYSKEIDTDKIKKRLINTIGTLAVYNDNKDTNFIDDFSTVLSSINDNDIKNDYMFINSDGEKLEDIHIQDYKEYKEKRHKELKYKLNLAQTTLID